MQVLVAGIGLTPELRVLVVQMGARRDYELARMLQHRGALAALQTGLAWSEWQTPMWFFDAVYPSKRSAALRRTVRGVPPEKVRTTFMPEAVGALLGSLPLDIERRYRIEDWFLGSAARRRGLAGSNVVLNTSGNGGVGFLRWAKAQGAKVVTDVVITPLVHEILAEEGGRWPHWIPARNMSRTMAIHRHHMEDVVAVSDLLICPSDTVVEGLATVRGFDPKRAVCIPYGLGMMNIKPGKPIAKRILFAGEAGLRKGLPYLACTARRLRARDPDFEVRVAGNAPEAIRALPECMDLTFLGHLGPEQIAQEFRTADLFCLPSLAEGMASVTLEALANGLPCVVTRSTGAPVKHGVEGFIVPERDTSALSDALVAIAGNRVLRERMSAAALQCAGGHSLEAAGNRLYQALLRLVASGFRADA